MVKIYGIKNCNSVKKALDWMALNNITYEFHDYKKVGADKKVLEKFIKKFGWEKVLNRKGMTWRQLSKEEQGNIKDENSAINLMQEKTSIIKRPLIDAGSNQLLGFDVDEYNNSLL